MAINSRKKNFQESSSPEFSAPASGNPSPFKPTGKGFFNQYPDFEATAGNSNAYLQNKATSKSNGYLYKIYLFVDAVETSWTLSGETGQGQLGRVFYPRNMTQGDFTIEGMVANQFEYDKLVHFVEHHHYSQMKPQGGLANSLDANNYPSVDFMLATPPMSHAFAAFDPLYYSIVIKNIAAGHERFLNFPSYTLTCKVVYDYLERPYQIQQPITSTITRQTVFGDASSPAPATAASTGGGAVTTEGAAPRAVFDSGGTGD